MNIKLKTYFVRVTTLNPKKMFVPEMNRSTIIDTTCNKTVAHEEWLQSYLEILGSSWNATKQCHNTFKFGDGHKVIAMPQVIMLAQSGNKKCLIKTKILVHITWSNDFSFNIHAQILSFFASHEQTGARINSLYCIENFTG